MNAEKKKLIAALSVEVIEAEARGFERGVREAAKVAEEYLGRHSLCEPAILALLEKPTS
jgi:hypothetical protein